MSEKNPLEKAIEIVGLRPLAAELGVSYVAVRKWQARQRLPRTEWTHETDYSDRIERLTGGAVTRAMLLAKWTALEAAPPQPLQEAA